MPFGRRHPLTLGSRLRNVVWPEMGLRRYLRLSGHRLHRLPGTTDSIAAGFGWGLGISMTPLLGGHIILSATAARLTGNSILAAVIATFVITPWTGPPVWLATYYLGRFLEGRENRGDVPSFTEVFRGMADALRSLDGTAFIEQVWPVFKPMMLGSIPIGVAAGVGGYLLLRPVLARFRAARAGAAIRH